MVVRLTKPVREMYLDSQFNPIRPKGSGIEAEEDDEAAAAAEEEPAR
jgi:hypothetical protein